MTEFIVSHFQWVLGALGVLIAGLIAFFRKKSTPPSESPALNTSLHDLVQKRAEEDQQDRHAEEARVSARAKQEILARVKIERDRVELVTKPNPTTDDADKLMRDIENMKTGDR